MIRSETATWGEANYVDFSSSNALPPLTFKVYFRVGAYGYIFTCGFIDMIKGEDAGICCGDCSRTQRLCAPSADPKSYNNIVLLAVKVIIEDKIMLTI